MPPPGEELLIVAWLASDAGVDGYVIVDVNTFDIVDTVCAACKQERADDRYCSLLAQSMRGARRKQILGSG